MLGNRPTIHVEEAHELFQRVIQKIHLGGLSNVFIAEGCPQIKQIDLFGNDFHTWHNARVRERESVRTRAMGLGM